MSAIEQLRRACTQPLEAARAAKAAGRSVIAYLGASVPVELIRASGAFAVQLAGDPAMATPLASLCLDDEFDGEIKSLFDQIANGSCNVADLIVIPRGSNGLLYLYYSLMERRRLEPQQAFPELLLYDVLNTPSQEAGQYVLGRTRALHARLGGSEPEVRQAIADANGMRRLLADLGARRRAGRLCGSTFWTALRAAQVMEPRTWFEAASALPDEAAPAARLMLKGYAQDTADLYVQAELLGANIVAEDTPNGERTMRHLVDESADPLAALADHYQRHVPTIRSWPQAVEDAQWLAHVDESRAQGVLFYHEEFDDTLGWDYPAQKALLEARGLPHALLNRQSYSQPDRDARHAALSALIERIAA